MTSALSDLAELVSMQGCAATLRIEPAEDGQVSVMLSFDEDSSDVRQITSTPEGVEPEILGVIEEVADDVSRSLKGLPENSVLAHWVTP